MLLLCVSAYAEDGQLAALRSVLAPLRQHANERRETRGATPELTVIKHYLRDWIESRLANFGETSNEDVLANELHDGLRDARLFCEGLCNLSLLGWVDDVKVTREREFLILRTSVGIWCGYDDSSYAYRWNGNGWQRVWQTEQTAYTKQQYRPQSIHEVRISAPDQNGNRLVLSLGSQPGCSASFQPVYYRVWRVGRGLKLLLDNSEFANVGYPDPIKGSVSPGEVLVKFTLGGIAYGFSHEAVRHFEVHGDKVKQVDPIAPSPRDFLEEWLSSSWTQSAARSESPSLKEAHQKLHRTDGMGDFPDPELHCARDPSLWQVGIGLHDVPDKTYYLVRWRQPDHFSMVAIHDHPDPDCVKPDPAVLKLVF